MQRAAARALRVALLLALLAAAGAANYARSNAKRFGKNPRGGGKFDAMDNAMMARRRECEATVRAAGGACMESPMDTENCAMRCVSAACYDKLYGADPLEQGEIDIIRGRSYRACVRSEIRNEQLRAAREERRNDAR